MLAHIQPIQARLLGKKIEKLEVLLSIPVQTTKNATTFEFLPKLHFQFLSMLFIPLHFEYKEL